MHSYRCRRPSAPPVPRAIPRPARHADFNPRAMARPSRRRRRWLLGLLLTSSTSTYGTASAADENRLRFGPPAGPEHVADAGRRSQPGVDSGASYDEPMRAAPADGISACQAVLPPRFARRPLIYPGGGRLKLGSATITLRYTIDERGETEDDSVAVVYERSGAARPKYFDLFAALARDTVKRYRYDFASAADCSKRQQHTLAFEFKAS